MWFRGKKLFLVLMALAPPALFGGAGESTRAAPGGRGTRLSIPQAMPAAHPGSRWALLVGIDRYESADIAPLGFAVADVKAVGEALVGRLGFPRDHVLVMAGDEPAASINRPTNTNVIKRLDFLAGEIGPEDTLLFYFSGHGYQREGGKHFLATVNADPTSIETLELTTLPLNLLRDKMTKIRAGRVVFFIDACRNDPEQGKGGGDNRLTGGFARDLSIVAASAGSGIAGAAVLFACSGGERAYEWPEQQHGVFSYYLLEGLKGAGAEPGGEITIASLGDYVQRSVSRWAREREKKQRPDLEQKGAARIVLGRCAPEAPTTNPAIPTKPPEPAPPAPVVPNKPPDATPSPLPPSGVAGKTWINPKDGMEFVYVPPGPFTMGSDTGGDCGPQQTVNLPGYWIGKTEVTVGQYRKFQEETHARGGATGWTNWDDQLPMAGINWSTAVAYCTWAGCRLPTEAEWEKAARGTDGRPYPWGNEWAASKCKSARTGSQGPVAVGSFAAGSSPYGCLDMAGNVWEWTSSLFRPYPYQADDGREDPNEDAPRVTRGGSGADLPDTLRVFVRHGVKPGTSGSSWLGFRCARTALPTEAASSPAPAAAGLPAPAAAGQTFTNPKDGMEFVHVPEGPFTLGSDNAGASEKPAHQVSLPAYWIGKCEVTIAQFRRFVAEQGYQFQGEWDPAGTDERLPMTNVTWNDAAAYCRWAGCRLPTEAEWEKAARGANGAEYPWGSEWDPAKCNCGDTGPKRKMPVGSYPAGASPFGCLDMAGNVSEWTSSIMKRYPYQPDDGREDPNAHESTVGRVYRSGDWGYTRSGPGALARDDLRACHRAASTSDFRLRSLGFRCARSAQQ